ncbi:hypothetical protein CSOJ01_01090 [Colletotrichum sojae]|uniref:Myb-like DNA-binding domain-containing protein n=1 Tax=Colletotrichum sojae TaxID=2175907 RepID=A0A8H6N4G1_9PEZI|nr:hypothetical protein CSOJ01_01090 [Colletotrichum sojae]
MASEGSSDAKVPTPGDVNFAFLIFKHIPEKPNIDWEAFAADAGFKNATVAAQTRYGQIRKKYSGQPAVPVTPRKSKAAENPASASKVTKPGGRVGTKGRKGKAAAKAEEDHQNELGKPEEGEIVDPFTSEK